MGGGAKATGGAGNATGGMEVSVARGGAALCSAAPFTFEEKSTGAACVAETDDEAGEEVREGAESLLTSFSSRTTRSRSQAARPRAAKATSSVKNVNMPALRRQATAFFGATNRSYRSIAAVEPNPIAESRIHIPPGFGPLR